MRIRFDRPMDRFAARFDWESGDCLSAGYPSYNSNTFEFAIPMRLAPGVLHQVVVNKDEPGVGAGFISAQGRPAGLYVWRFTTGTGPGAPAAGQPAPAPALPGGSTGEAALNRFHQHYVVPAAFPALGGGTGVAASGSNAVRLLTLLEAMQRRRAQLTSLVEHAQLTTQYHGPGLRLISFQGTTFKWQRPSQYYGDVSQIMGGPFRVGGDGTNWWWETGSAETPDLVLCPTNEMQLQDISLADPFGLELDSPAKAAQKLGLVYASLTNIAGADCYVVESRPGGPAAAPSKRWCINAQSFLVAELETEWNRTRFLYEPLNCPLPPTAFAPARPPGLKLTPLDALDAGFTNRFMSLRDGSDGRMSVRWGKIGPKETSSSGLN